jgi:hypothetical protein
MKTKLQKWMSYLSLLSILAVLSPITGNHKWESFLPFLAFMAFTRVKADERFKSNMNKACRNGFIASVIGVIGMAFVLNSGPSMNTLVITLQVILWTMVIVFAASFTFFDRKGI